ncbi:MAG: hypothetical protein V2A67_06690 [Bacteroidota bacterium]
METVKKPNPYIRYGVFIAVLGVFLWTYFQEKKPRIETGNLEFRMVSGLQEGTFQVILIETPDRYVILDSTCREVLNLEDGEMVSRPEQLKLLEKYQNIEYRVGFNEGSTGTKPSYRVTREVFNSVAFGHPIQYEVSKKAKDALVKLVTR